MSKKRQEKRVTKLVRFSYTSHKLLKTLARIRKMTMSKTLDHIINKYFKYQDLYEIN